MAFGQIKEDHAIHVSFGMAISATSMQVNESIFKGKNQFVWAAGSATVAGIGKELYDSQQPYNRFDWSEVGYTVFGGLVGWGLAEIGVPKIIMIAVGIATGGVMMTF